MSCKLGVQHSVLRILAFWICSVLTVFNAHEARAEISSAAVALLRGVESVRTRQDSYKVTMAIELEQSRMIDCLIEWDGTRRRFEIFARENSDGAPGSVLTCDGSEVFRFNRSKHEDVRVYGVDHFEKSIPDLAFDARTLGLLVLIPTSATVRDCVWYEGMDDIKLVGQEEINGVSVWLVKSTRGSTVTDYWIEEPSFRVHRRTVRWPGTDLEIDSEFDPSDPKSPFPQRVIATNKSDKSRNHKRIYTVKSFDFGAKISPERFTLKAMDLPVNTPVVDYRIQRRIGFWDGAGLSELPVNLNETPVDLSDAAGQRTRRFLLIGVNVAIVLSLILVILWRRNARLAAAN